MLTTTYALATISIEQKNTRSMLNKLEQKIQKHNSENQTSFDLNYLKTIFTQVIQFDKYCRGRKVEVYIIPAIHKASIELDALLADLEALSAQGLKMIRSLYEQIQLFLHKGVDQIDSFFATVECYCQSLRRRLNQEEQELFPVARRVLSFDQWFSIAVECLSEEAQGHRKPSITSQNLDIYDLAPINSLLGGGAYFDLSKPVYAPQYSNA